MPIQIGINNAIKGGSGTGTGGGGDTPRTAPIFQYKLLPSDRVPKNVSFAFQSLSTFPFKVFIGGDTYVINSSADRVDVQTSSFEPTDVSLSVGAEVKLDWAIGGSFGINKVLRLENLKVGISEFIYYEDRDFSGISTLPFEILSDLSGCFSNATGLPSNIGLWKVDGVTLFNNMFAEVPESVMSDTFGQWQFGDGADLGTSSFSNLSDADLASCLVQWEANANQGINVDAAGLPFGSDPSGGGAERDLDETVYPDALSAYDNLEDANSNWDFGTSINWFTPAPLLLDDYPNAASAYSVRKLSSTYSGSAIEAYRVSDGATQDIGFDGDGLLNTADIISFASGSVVRVRTWYDQSGNSLDATQTTPDDMPQIYDGVAIEMLGEKPAIKTIQVSNTVGDYLASPATTWMDSNLEYACVTLFSPSGANNGDTWVWDSSGGGTNKAPSIKSVSTAGIEMQAYGTTPATVTIPHDSQAIRSASLSNGTLEAFKNALSSGTASASGTYNANIARYIGTRWGAGEGRYDGLFQELIWYASDQKNNLLAIESNVNSYYQVANLPATSGFLADYPDAAAAHSVRQLSNNAIKCMRVRRFVAPFDEQDIGFTADGDLDEAAIVAFGGSDSLLVSAWYDQSGQQNHATQVTPGSQPKIYDGTQVVTVNGKPSLGFVRNASQSLKIDNSGLDIGTLTSMCVMKFNSIISGQVGLSLSGNSTFYPNKRWYAPYYSSNGANFFYFHGATNVSTAADQSQHLHSMIKSPSSNAAPSLDGTALSTISSTATGVDLATDVGMCFWNNSFYADANQQEVIYWSIDQTSNRTAIETDIMTYYGIP